MSRGKAKVDHRRTDLNARQEAFALLLSTGMSQGEAYRAAGYEAKGDSAYEASSRLAKSIKVQSRVAEAKAAREQALVVRQAAAAVYTAASVSAMLAHSYAEAHRLGQVGAAVQASLGIAKLQGLLVDKTEDVTRRASRSPSAPIEIEVDHWLTEHGALPVLEGSEGSEPKSPSQEERVDDMGLVEKPNDINDLAESSSTPGVEPGNGPGPLLRGLPLAENNNEDLT